MVNCYQPFVKLPLWKAGNHNNTTWKLELSVLPKPFAVGSHHPTLLNQSASYIEEVAAAIAKLATSASEYKVVGADVGPSLYVFHLQLMLDQPVFVLAVFVV